MDGWSVSSLTLCTPWLVCSSAGLQPFFVNV
jgi:hypothetical protein